MKRLACVVFELEDDENVEVLIQNIESLSHVKVCKDAMNQSTWKKQMSDMLIKLGVPTNCGGYKLLFEAVRIAEKAPRITMQEIYAQLGDKCNMDEESVASQIRYVIYKIVDNNTVKQITHALGLPKDTSIKITPSVLIKYFVSTLF